MTVAFKMWSVWEDYSTAMGMNAYFPREVSGNRECYLQYMYELQFNILFDLWKILNLPLH